MPDKYRVLTSELADKLAHYLEVRQHTLSTAHLANIPRLVAEAQYVAGEADELLTAIEDYVHVLETAGDDEFTVDELAEVRHEIADVVLAATTLAGMLPGGVTVEACIAEKTEFDRGRG